MLAQQWSRLRTSRLFWPMARGCQWQSIYIRMQTSQASPDKCCFCRLQHFYMYMPECEGNWLYHVLDSGLITSGHLTSGTSSSIRSSGHACMLVNSHILVQGWQLSQCQVQSQSSHDAWSTILILCLFRGSCTKFMGPAPVCTASSSSIHVQAIRGCRCNQVVLWVPC